VLGPTEEIQATLSLCDLSRQAKRLKLAERVVLDPLIASGANLDGSVFGFDVPDGLALKLPLVDTSKSSSMGSMIDRLVTGSTSDCAVRYGPQHKQFVQQILEKAGGLER
jgi:hypothetical protein